MDATGLMIDAGLIVSAIAAAVVYCLYGRHMAIVPERGRRAVVIVALLFQAGVLLSDVSDRRSVALRLEETESKLLQMEEIMQDYEKHNHDVVSNLATMMSKNPGNIKKMSYNTVRSSDGTAKAELTVTMKDADDDRPPADDDHAAAETMEAASKLNDEVPPPSHGNDGIGEEKPKPKPWRSFSIPPDYVFVLDCEDDKLTIHIRPTTAEDMAGGSGEATRAGAGHACSSSRQAGTTALFLSDRGTYHTLFLARPGEERFLPVPWPRAEMFQKVTDATLRRKESPMVHEQAVPESLYLSPDVVAFYRGREDGTTELIVVATEAVEQKELSEEEVVWALTALTLPPSSPYHFHKFTPRKKSDSLVIRALRISHEQP